jgi:hypothetical protein
LPLFAIKSGPTCIDEASVKNVLLSCNPDGVVSTSLTVTPICREGAGPDMSLVYNVTARKSRTLWARAFLKTALSANRIESRYKFRENNSLQLMPACAG